MFRKIHDENDADAFFARVQSNPNSPLYKVMNYNKNDTEEEAKIRSRLTKKINPFLVDRLISQDYHDENLVLPPYTVCGATIATTLNQEDVKALMLCIKRNPNIKTLDFGDYHLEYFNMKKILKNAFTKNKVLTSVVVNGEVWFKRTAQSPKNKAIK